MHPARIILTVVTDDLSNSTYVFDQPTHCVVGRAFDCDLQLPPDPAHAEVSRHHCLLEVDPPTARVHDLGSLNGTFVNGICIGHGRGNCPPRFIDPSQAGDRELTDGDLLQVGPTVFRVGIDASGAPR